MSKNQLIDFISGLEVQATLEEIDAVQVFSKQLVEDYGYLKKQITTHPQFRVKSTPSDTKGQYPVDIAVFRTFQKKMTKYIFLWNVRKKIEKMEEIS